MERVVVAEGHPDFASVRGLLLRASISLPQGATPSPRPAVYLQQGTAWPHPPGKDQTAGPHV